MNAESGQMIQIYPHFVCFVSINLKCKFGAAQRIVSPFSASNKTKYRSSHLQNEQNFVIPKRINDVPKRLKWRPQNEPLKLPKQAVAHPDDQLSPKATTMTLSNYTGSTLGFLALRSDIFFCYNWEHVSANKDKNWISVLMIFS